MKIQEEKEECWSANNEDFRHNSIGDLLDSHNDLKVGDVVYVGDADRPKPRQICDADDIISMMKDRAWDIGGEYAEDYPDVSEAAHQELDEFIESWIAKHCLPDFYQVTDAREHVLAAEDFE